MLEPSEIVHRMHKRPAFEINPDDWWTLAIYSVLPQVNQFLLVDDDLHTMTNVALDALDTTDDLMQNAMMHDAAAFFQDRFIEDTLITFAHNGDMYDYVIGMGENRFLITWGLLCDVGFIARYTVSYDLHGDDHTVACYESDNHLIGAVLQMTEEHKAHARFGATFIVILLTLLAQNYSDVVEATPSNRAENRRLARTGVPISQFKMASLKRRKTAPGEPTGDKIDWSHRWTVRPHWRNQWYPSLGIHKRIFIHSYVKGPEDKDLVVKSTFFKP